MYNDAQEYIDYIHKNKIVTSTENIGSVCPLDVKVVNPAQDWDKISNEYKKNRISVIDNFLYPEYAERLKNFYLNCNSRQDTYDDYTALNFHKDKLWFSLLTNITNEVKDYFPIVNNLEFQRAWAFLYENESKGVPAHIDPPPACLTMNLWVTPDDCLNIKEKYNGLNIFKIKSNVESKNNIYNAPPDKTIHNLIKDADRLNIEYKFNRVCIFDSDFYHQSDPISAKKGYENRRVNYTFLYQKKINLDEFDPCLM